MSNKANKIQKEQKMVSSYPEAAAVTKQARICDQYDFVGYSPVRNVNTGTPQNTVTAVHYEAAESTKDNSVQWLIQEIKGSAQSELPHHR